MPAMKLMTPTNGHQDEEAARRERPVRRQHGAEGAICRRPGVDPSCVVLGFSSITVEPFPPVRKPGA